jgi:hypothetical protein
MITILATLATLVACIGTDTTTGESDSATTEEVLPIELGDCADGTVLGWADVEAITAAAAIGGNSFLTWSMIYSGQMPKNTGPLPDDERWVLWEWLSCGGPE